VVIAAQRDGPLEALGIGAAEASQNASSLSSVLQQYGAKLEKLFGLTVERPRPATADLTPRQIYLRAAPGRVKIAAGADNPTGAGRGNGHIQQWRLIRSAD
jgi:hypothetical protein